MTTATRIAYVVCVLCIFAMLAAIGLKAEDRRILKPRAKQFEGCQPTPVPDSCVVPEQCLSCHPSMN